MLTFGACDQCGTVVTIKSPDASDGTGIDNEKPHADWHKALASTVLELTSEIVKPPES